MKNLTYVALALLVAASTVHADPAAILKEQHQEIINQVQKMEDAFGWAERIIDSAWHYDAANYMAIPSCMNIPHCEDRALAVMDKITKELMQLAQYKSVPGYKRCVKKLRKKLLPHLSQECSEHKAIHQDSPIGVVAYYPEEFSAGSVSESAALTGFISIFLSGGATLFALKQSSCAIETIKKFPGLAPLVATLLTLGVSVGGGVIVGNTVHYLQTLKNRIIHNAKNEELKNFVDRLNSILHNRMQEKIIPALNLLEDLAGK